MKDDDTFQASDALRDSPGGIGAHPDSDGGHGEAATGETLGKPRIVGRCVSRVKRPWHGAPGYGAPGYGAPGYGAPGYGAPGYGAPGYGAPWHGAPGYGAPWHGAPGYGAPGYGAPGYGAPGYGAPWHGALGYGAPWHGAPGYGAPWHGAPGDGAPGDGAPEYGAPFISTHPCPPCHCPICRFQAHDACPNVIDAHPLRGNAPVYGWSNQQPWSVAPGDRSFNVGTLSLLLVIAVVLIIGGLMALDIDVGSVLVNDKPAVTVAFDSSDPSVNDSLAIIHPASVTFQEYADAMAKLSPVFAASELQAIYDALNARGIDPAVHAAVVSFDVQAAGEAVNPPYRNVHGVMRYGSSSYEMVSYPSYLAAVQDWMRRVCPQFPTDACRGKTVEFIVKQQCFPPNCDSEVVLTRMREYVASLRASQSSP